MSSCMATATRSSSLWPLRKYRPEPCRRLALRMSERSLLLQASPACFAGRAKIVSVSCRWAVTLGPTQCWICWL
eukprot:11201610-Lingulodinium_polyedra.AAC.1